MTLGDVISSALARVGVTPAAVSGWLGGPCGCEERRLKLNALGAWARAAGKVGVGRAGRYLVVLVGGK